MMNILFTTDPLNYATTDCGNDRRSAVFFVCPFNRTIAAVALFVFYFLLSPVVAQQQPDEPKTYLEFAKLKVELSEEFRSQPNLPLEERISRLQRLVNLELNAIEKLEKTDGSVETYIEGFSEKPDVHISRLNGAMIPDSFLLANLLQEAGQYAESVTAMEIVFARSKKHYGEEHWRTREFELKLGTAKWLANASADQLARWGIAKAASNEALAAFQKQDWPLIRTNLEKSKSILEELGLQNTMAYGEAVANLAEAIAATNDVNETEAAFTAAFEVNDRLFQKKSPTNGSMRQSLAQFYIRNGISDKAMEKSEEAAAFFKLALGEKSNELAINLNLRAIQYQRLKQYQVSQQHFLQSITMFNELGLKNTWQYNSVMQNYYEFATEVSSYSEAAGAAAIGIDVATVVYGEQSNETANWLLRAGESNRLLENYDKAAEHYSKAKTIYESTAEYGKNQSYISCLIGLAQAFISLNKPEQAIELSKKSTELSKDLAGENSLYYLAKAQNLAVILFRAGQHEQAEEMFAQVVPQLKEMLGESHYNYQQTINDRASNFLQDKKLDAAIKEWQELLRLQAASIGTAHADYQSTLGRLIDAHEEKGDDAAAGELKKQLEELKKAAAEKTKPIDETESPDG